MAASWNALVIDFPYRILYTETLFSYATYTVQAKYKAELGKGIKKQMLSLKQSERKVDGSPHFSRRCRQARYSHRDSLAVSAA